MTLDAPSAVAAPLRRSSRIVTTPAPQPQRVLTRAELRRLAAQQVEDHDPRIDADPATAAAPREQVQSDVAAADAAQTHAAELAVVLVAAAAVELPAALANSAAVLPEVRDDAHDDAGAMPVASTVPIACAVPPAAVPTSRRARRAAAASAPEKLASDEFERAARLFCFEGGASAPAPAAASRPAPPETIAHTAGDAVRPPRMALARRRLAAASASLGAMSVVGLLAIGLTTPAGAMASVAGSKPAGAASTSLTTAASSSQNHEEIQAFVSSASTESVDLARDETYSTATMADLAAGSGVRNFDNSFLNNPNSPVQWPFPVGVPYTWGFQMRDGSMHHGIDFVPGQGAEIHAIADGTVRVATEAGGLYGVHVVVDHVIDGELVSSHYAHMEYGSLRVKAGDTLKVGDVLGTVGDTGYSFGAHLHFEIWQNGTTRIDPLEWMRDHTAG
ncbi:M23 family metallopeptidase [Microbacterium sp. zg.Y909]|uniref:M23 family metallopeptidase n=1 Tax=Microbacterium sp. zg.Y909 TaxID=2969413 RepID=UPI00214C82AA|nr:M23 family metallopeptidase [Microbacterium sp. zg.Y909]MCR2824831.1 M23 family metallopeptidase [Microbacterium sp. zg.Y909]